MDYDEWSRTLLVAFHDGSAYEYFQVPPSEFSGLLNASSHGKYFHAYIKNCYSWRKIA